MWFTNLRLYARCQGLDDLMDRKWCRWRGTFLVLETPAWRSGYYCSGGGWVQPLTVCVLVQRCVPRLRLILPHHKPGQRQVFDWWDRNPFTGLEEGFVKLIFRCKFTPDCQISVCEVWWFSWVIFIFADRFTFLPRVFLLQLFTVYFFQNA